MKYDWTIEKDGVPIGRLSEPEYEEMFWHSAIFTPVADASVSGEYVFEKDYWQNCNYVVRHTFSGKELQHVIIRNSDKPNRLLVRGIPVE